MVAGTMVVADILDKLEIESVVGVPTSTVELPARYDDAEEIGNAMDPDMEIVKSLNPDVFISVTTLEYDLKPIVENINVAGRYLDLQGIKQMQQSILALGKDFGREAQAKKLVASFETKLAALKEQ
ncbi:ABC transporter substrate-binding protein, partial [Staphylococcus haemolyticus]|uniref:ABC transporter substrate-binding protein n=1 Tax=Staphylococcus haemolyticus TaxID=1283 RepID=UPI00214D2C57